MCLTFSSLNVTKPYYLTFFHIFINRGYHFIKYVSFLNHLNFLKKLHFTTLNYALDYSLHHKQSDCTLCILNYHTYHTLHLDVIFAVIFNKILLHVTNMCFLLRWNNVKRLKHPSSKSIKTKSKIFHIALCLAWCHPLPQIQFQTI